MNSSISNSKNYYLKVAALAIVVISTYNILLFAMQPRITTFQSQWIANYSRAETFLYKNPSPKVIIVGSSMSARLQDDRLDREIHNLSFGGGSALTGLKIIRESDRLPDLICVETNIIERELNREMVRSLFTPAVWKMKKYLIVLQYTYQPMNIFLTIVNSRFGQGYENQKNEKPDPGVFKIEIARHLKEESTTDGLDNSPEINEIRDLIDYFCSKGVRIMFFQMPVCRELSSSERYSYREKILRQAFSNIKCQWSHAGSDYEKYSTADGIHLTPRSAGEFTEELNKAIKQVLPK